MTKLGCSFLVVFSLVSCSEAAMESGKKVTTQGLERNKEDPATTEPSQRDTSDQIADPSSDMPPKEMYTAVPGGHLNCALDYAGLPAATPEPRYGCRLALANLDGVKVPADVKRELRFYAGDKQVPITVTDAPATSLWQWYVSTPAKGPLSSELVVRDADVVVDPKLAVTAGSKMYAFAKTPVEGSSMTWSATAQVSMTQTVNDQYRASSPTRLSFRTVFPKYITINRATGKTTDMILGFYLDTNGGNAVKLTCRYKLVPSLPTYYIFDPATCRRGTADFDKVATNSPSSDLNNTPVSFTLDTPVADMRDGWYTDWAFTGAMISLEPPRGTVQTASIREFAMP